MFEETISLVSIGIMSSFFAGHPTGQSRNRNKMSANADASSMVAQLVVFLLLLPITLWAQELFGYVPVVSLFNLIKRKI